MMYIPRMIPWDLSKINFDKTTPKDYGEWLSNRRKNKIKRNKVKRSGK